MMFRIAANRMTAQFVSATARACSWRHGRPTSSMFQQHSFSSSNSSTSSPLAVTPPASLNEEMALGVQNATYLLIKHGLGKKQLIEVAKGARGSQDTLVPRWQKMMQAYLGSQVHIIAGLGYSPDEGGVALYNYHLSQLMAMADPDTQEKLR